MSDLYHRYDRAAVSELIAQPPFAELADRGRRRAHRTRTVRFAGVAVLAALVAAPLLARPGGSRPEAPGGSPPGAERMWSGRDAIVTFLDIRNGLAQYGDQTCGKGWVSVTRDGGRNWSELREHPNIPDRRTGARPDVRACQRSAPILIAPDTLVLAAPVQPPDMTGEPAFISHDAGRTWREYQPRVRVADSVPNGTVPWWPCDEQPCKEAGLGWYDPQTGDWMVLRSQPPGAEYSAISVGFDGSLWVYGAGAFGDDDFRLAVSRDRGRSWADRTPDADIGWLATSGLAIHDGDTAYLYSMDTRSDPFDLYRTSDGGVTWRHVHVAPRLAEILGVWVNRDGRLGVTDGARNQYLSADGGKTFARIELPVCAAEGITGGLQGWPFESAAADPVDFYLSEDGLTWQPVQVPYYQ